MMGEFRKSVRPSDNTTKRRSESYFLHNLIERSKNKIAALESKFLPVSQSLSRPVGISLFTFYFSL